VYFESAKGREYALVYILMHTYLFDINNWTNVINCVSCLFCYSFTTL